LSRFYSISIFIFAKNYHKSKIKSNLFRLI
jgi:hypothetical protein